MAEKPYMPHADTLAYRVCVFFRRFDDEELTAADIAQKWGSEKGYVWNKLAMSVNAGLLSRDGSVYKAGPNIGRIDLTPQAVQTMDKPAPRLAPSAPSVNVDAVSFEEGVTLPTQRPTAVVQWAEKMRQMKIGQSFKQPVEQAYCLRTAATILNKEGGRRMRVFGEVGDPSHVRVFCLGVDQ